MDWYLNPALTTFRKEVNARWPNRDKTSDGTIGDAAHQATNSDHNPDKDGSVDAWDMDVDGVDVWACINAALKHESIQYVIYNRKITSRSWGLGIWRDYNGPNPHDKHVHFNTRESHENSTKPWFKEEDMPISDADAGKIATANWSASFGKTNPETAGERLADIKNTVRALSEKVDKLLATPPGSVVISDEQLERVLRKVVGSVDNVS